MQHPLLEDTHLPLGILPESVEVVPNVFFCPMDTGNVGFIVSSEGIVVINTGDAHDRNCVIRRIRRYFTLPLRWIICTDSEGASNLPPLLEESGTMSPTVIVQRNQILKASCSVLQYDAFLSLSIGEFLLHIHHNGDEAWVHIVSHDIIFGTLPPLERPLLLGAAGLLLPRFGVRVTTVHWNEEEPAKP